MPTYEYRCSFCGPFTRLRSIREETATSSCPDCGESATRVFGVPQVFHRTTSVQRARGDAAKTRGSSTNT